MSKKGFSISWNPANHAAAIQLCEQLPFGSLSEMLEYFFVEMAELINRDAVDDLPDTGEWTMTEMSRRQMIRSGTMDRLLALSAHFADHPKDNPTGELYFADRMMGYFVSRGIDDFLSESGIKIDFSEFSNFSQMSAQEKRETLEAHRLKKRAERWDNMTERVM